MMNPESLDLLHGYLDCRLGPEDMARLESLLRQSPEARATLRSMASIDAKWELLAVTESPGDTESVALDPAPARLRRWILWRTPVAAAAGVLFGLLSASVLWAVSAPRALERTVQVSGLVDGRFESVKRDLPRGFPTSFGVWGGDPAESVKFDSGAVRSALRFVSAARERLRPEWETLNAPRTCDVYQLVDLRPLRAEIGGDPAPILEMSADFLDARSEPGEPLRFICHLHLFGGREAADEKAAWLTQSRDALSVARAHLQSRGGAEGGGSWKRLTARCVVPLEAEHAVVWLAVAGSAGLQRSEPPIGEQFVSNVTLTLKTRHSLPAQGQNP
jgi:hypothetical protein